MNKILEETLAQEKPDLRFEQRMLAGFRNRVPQRAGPVRLLVDLMRLRPVQIATVAAVLLGLVQMGRMITEIARYADRTFRIGGDEFAILMPHTDADGNFQVEGLIPDLKYNLVLVHMEGAFPFEQIQWKGLVFSNLVLKPGENKNLGDVRLQPFPK